MENIDLSALSAAQRTELKSQLEAEGKAAAQRIVQERGNYKSMVDTFVRENIAKLQALSEQMLTIKTEIFADSDTLVAMKDELFKTKPDRRSNSFTTSDGTMTITMGNRTNEGWDDTVNEGIAKVREYIGTLARDENSTALVETIMGLIAKDRKGNLKANKVLELEKLAVKTQDRSFLDGIGIIKDAYRPTASCQFIEASVKDDKGNELKLPLSLAAMK